MATELRIHGRFCTEEGTPVSPVSLLPADFLTRDFIYVQGEKEHKPVHFTFKVTDVRATVIGDQTVHSICIAHYAPPKPHFLERCLVWLNRSILTASVGCFVIIALIWLITVTIWPGMVDFASQPVAYFGYILWNMDSMLLYLTSCTVIISTFYFLFRDKYFWAMAPAVFWAFAYLALIRLFDLLPVPNNAPPEEWPADFSQYARDFFDEQATALAALKVAMPALIAILNLIGLTLIGKLVDIAFKTAGARTAEIEEEEKAKKMDPAPGRTLGRTDAPGAVVAFGAVKDEVPPILQLPLDPANALLSTRRQPIT